MRSSLNVKRSLQVHLKVLMVGAILACGTVSAAAQDPALNLLTPNLADVIWDTGGFTGATGGGTTPSLSRDTTVAWSGESSLRITGDGSRRGQGVWMSSIFVPDNRGTYTFSGYIKGTPGDSYYVAFEEKGPAGTGVQVTHEVAPFKIAGTDWQRFSATVTMETGDSLGVTVRHDTAAPFDVWLDGMQLELGQTATAWNAPRYTKNLVNYNQATVEYDARGLIGLAGATVSRDTTHSWEGAASLKVEGKGTADGQGIYMWPAFITKVGEPYTFSVYVSGQAGDVFYLTVEEKGHAGTGLQSTPATGTPFVLKGDGWERQSISFTAQSSQRVNLTLKHSTKAPFTLYVDGLQLEAGASATTWEAPAKP